MKKGLSLILFVILLSPLSGQDYDIGIRAGLNFAQFSGPTELDVNESYSISSGFHFGISFQWNFNSFFGLKSEIMYSQIGTKYEYNDIGYYLFDFVNTVDVERFVVKDQSNLTLDVSNAHISFPITGHVSLGEKFEIFGGAYFNLLVSPVGIGEWTFGEPGLNAPDHTFRQTLDYNYNSDWAGPFGVNRIGQPILIIVNNQDVDLASLPGAYFLLPPNDVTFDINEDSNNIFEPPVKRFKGIDYGVIGGISYYINKGLYLSARLEYGLNDITNQEVDYSIKNVNDDGSLIFNDDFDRNINLGISLGFRF
ncbi:MAG: outer membrane beta-barrel protein [Saprospiraceae bacterium]|nr:outer membrane beta-barrel protein [Saprospiraceae bacterium]|tara:strand:- start:842 stop:1768 length:927 start_codon:yes stop_codon:yes gene_type:complete